MEVPMPAVECPICRSVVSLPEDGRTRIQAEDNTPLIPEIAAWLKAQRPCVGPLQATATLSPTALVPRAWQAGFRAWVDGADPAVPEEFKDVATEFLAGWAANESIHHPEPEPLPWQPWDRRLKGEKLEAAKEAYAQGRVIGLRLESCRDQAEAIQDRDLREAFHAGHAAGYVESMPEFSPDDFDYYPDDAEET